MNRKIETLTIIRKRVVGDEIVDTFEEIEDLPVRPQIRDGAKITICGTPIFGKDGERIARLHKIVDDTCAAHPEMIPHLRGGQR